MKLCLIVLNVVVGVVEKERGSALLRPALTAQLVTVSR